MSTKRVKELKKLIQYDNSAPRCCTCDNYIQPRHAVPNHTLVAHRYYRPARCGLHDITVAATAICNDWSGICGQTLEKQDGEV